jgi:hypothetical protein
MVIEIRQKAAFNRFARRNSQTTDAPPEAAPQPDHSLF